MAYPKRKNDIEIYTKKENIERREELLKEIVKSDVNLPDGILHDDLDSGMLEYVKKNFIVVSNGKKIPILDKIFTIQKLGEYSNNWDLVDSDNNIKLPFIGVIRKPDVQPGTNPITQRTIPNRQNFFYQSVETWDGTQKGAEVYKIPQPVAVDISYDITIVCNEMRDLNRFNKVVLQKFSSRQSYTSIKGHYIPIVLDSIDDNTPISSVEGRRFYLQNYKFTLLGYLLDPEEFEVKPTINRLLLMNEYTEKKINRVQVVPNVEIVTITFDSDGLQTSYNVGEKIGFLINVSINGLIQEKNSDYFHIQGTSKVTFSEPPLIHSIITMTYYKGKKTTIIDSDGRLLHFITEYFDYDGNNELTLSHLASSLITVDINGLIEDNRDGYIINEKKITLMSPPEVGSTIGITYIYY